MIYNERQYKITAKQIEEFANVLLTLQENKEQDWLMKAQIDAIKSQSSDLVSQILEYDLVKEGKVRFTECSDLSSLPETLIKARIAKGLSQKDFASYLGMTAQQIQRYEASNYMGASLSRLIEISAILEIKITESWGGQKSTSGDSIFSWDESNSVDWSKFPLQEMIKKNWLKIQHKMSPIEAVKNFFIESAGSQYVTALHRKKFHGGNTPNEYALLAWQARVLNKARNEYHVGNIPDFHLDDSWLPELISLSTLADSPLRVKNFLASKGIILIVEEHLKGTYLDGAAMLLETGNPVVALTLRYDRLDNFWFVLMHELGHVFLHLFDSLNMDFFDEENGNEEDEIEKEADLFALDTLISNNDWDMCLSRFSSSRDNVVMDATNLAIHPSIIAGRIRKEQNNFILLNDVLGHGEVRRNFGEGI
jgi:HTH-type transcriptional regulator/antitoxin HigA